ncbi:MAG TPA: MmcQ/YjbR family DNA-binding protein [Sulfurovum sp.]|uniref:MmcQ/YjbR family DNA-binding protein n=1 Tax=Sulfurovum sp. TaxID=1969726 RepID=UPI002F928DEA
MREKTMDFEELDTYLRSKQGVTFDYPFDEKVRVYRIGDKMIALTWEEEPLRVNLKCDPLYALELRSLYEGITAGYHMNKKHWNTVTVEGSDVDEETVRELIDHSYDLVYQKLTKRQKELLG